MASSFSIGQRSFLPIMGKDLIFSVCVVVLREAVGYIPKCWLCFRLLRNDCQCVSHPFSSLLPPGSLRDLPGLQKDGLMGGWLDCCSASPPGFITAPSVSYSGSWRVQQFKAPLRAASEHFFILPRPNFLARKRALQPRASHPSSPGYIELAANRPHAVLALLGICIRIAVLIPVHFTIFSFHDLSVRSLRWIIPIYSIRLGGNVRWYFSVMAQIRKLRVYLVNLKRRKCC